MKDFTKLCIAFAAWCVIILSAFMTLVLELTPGVELGKPVIVIVAVLQIAGAVAVRLFDPAFAKKVTSATGK